MIYLAVVTSIAATLFLLFMLKTLDYFKIISWNPVGYAEKFNILENHHTLLKWFVLALMIFLLIFLFYVVMQYVTQISPFVTSLVIGVVVAVLAEWIILNLPAERSSFKKLSIPFMVTMIIIARFVIETATFHYQASNNQNKLPYNDTVIK